MSNPTSTTQLWGGLPSISPSAVPSSLFTSSDQSLDLPSGEFNSLWVGLTQSTENTISLADQQRQTAVTTTEEDGMLLPLGIPLKTLQQIENVLQDKSLQHDEALGMALSVLRKAIQDLDSEASKQTELQTPVNESVNQKLNAEDSEETLKSTLTESADVSPTLQSTLEVANFSDAQLMSYLKMIVKSFEAASASEQKQSLTEKSFSEKLFLEKQFSQESEDLTEKKQDAAEVRLNQLRAEIEASREIRESATLNLSVVNDPIEKNESDQVKTTLLDLEVVSKQETQPSVQPTVQPQVETPLKEVTTEKPSESLLPPLGITEKSPQQLPVEKAALSSIDPRAVLMPTTPVPRGPINNDVIVEKGNVADVNMMQAGKRSVLLEAINQVNTQRSAVQELAADDLNRRQESATLSAGASDTARIAPSLSSPTQSPMAQAHNAQDALMQKMLNPAWSRALGERAVMMAQQGPRMAEVRLDPPELGSLRIRVQVHGNDQVSLIFTAPSAAVREVLEQSMPRLREMFLEQGMNLSDASVSDQSAKDQSDQPHTAERAKTTGGMNRDEFGELPAHRTELRKVGIIDYYA